MLRLKGLLDGIVDGFRMRRLSPRPPRRVLIVDDEASTRLFLSVVLSVAGYDTTVAANGLEALTMYETRGPFDVVVTDVMMPRMHGHELARRIRQVHTDAKILYVTGYSDALFDAKLWLWEDEALLEKPFTPDGVVEAVSLLVDRRVHPTTLWG
jgi:CheY-like chemotaxis protein